MIVPDYVAGEWVAVVTDGTVAVLAPDADPVLVERLWDSVRGGASLTDHLQLLLAEGIAALPPFALVRLSAGHVQAIVRGAVRVEVRTSQGVRVLSAEHVQTWSEETVEGALGVRVRTARDDVPGATFPVLSGVVRAAEVRVDLGGPTGRPPVVAGVGASGAARAPGGDAPADAAPAPASTRRRGAEPPAEVTPAPAAPTPASPVPPAPGEPAPAVPTPAVQATPVSAVPAQATPARPVPAPVPPVASAPPAPPVPSVPSVPSVPGAGDPGDPLATSPRTAPYVPPAPPAPATSPARPAPDAEESPARPPWERVGAGPRPGAGHTEDHDGLTVLSSDVVALRRQLPDWAGDAVPGPLAVPTPRTKAPAKIQLSSGLVVSLNRPVLLGRAPQVARVQNSEIPRLVTVPSPNQDISRTHAEVRMDGDDVLVTDLRSTNGVLLLRQGASPQRLHPGEATVVEPGVVVDLGEGVTFIVEAGG